MYDELTVEERDKELSRQMRLVMKGESRTVVCPWCAVIIDPETEECCYEMTQAMERRGRASIESIVRQRSDVLAKRSTSIECPYCGAWNYVMAIKDEANWKRPGISPWCCDMFAEAVKAITWLEIQNREIQNRIDHMNRIAEGFERAIKN